MKPLKIFGIALVIGLVVVLMMERAAREKLRVENESLSQQLAQLQTDNENFSNQLVQAKSAASLPDDKLNELMKLRGEVSVLHNQLAKLGKVADENQQLRSKNSAAQNKIVELSPSDQFELQIFHAQNNLKQLGLAMKIFSGDNNGQYATNFDQFKLILPDYTSWVSNFEFVNVGLVNDSMPQAIIFRERVPEVNPNGYWERIYGLADGSVQRVWGGRQGDTKQFDDFEKQHSPPPNQQP